VRSAFGRITGWEREIGASIDVQGMDYDETGTVTNSTIDTAMSRLASVRPR
jgi:DNA-directed RNA polymerase specialized sigma24 family protein